jgi:hypothetical protein
MMPADPRYYMVARSKSFGIKLLTLSMVLLASSIVQASDQQSPPTEEEWHLARLVNEYRVENDLSAVLVTNSLTNVAQAHVAVLNTHHPDTATFGTADCNHHGWSSHGDWTAVCYTGSPRPPRRGTSPARSPSAVMATAMRSHIGTARRQRLLPPWTNG